MNKKLMYLSFVAVLMAVYGSSSIADTIYIPRNYYSGLDHGNPAHEGSIASYFSQHGANNRYILTTPSAEGSYGVYTPLILPQGSSLESGGEDSAWIRAYANMPQLLTITNSSSIDSVILDGNYLVNHVLNGNEVKNFILSGSIIKKTKNNNGGAEVKAHLVSIQNSTNIRIVDNLITQAGDSGVDVGSENTEASGLYLVDNVGVEVRDNEITYALSAGINITNSVFVYVTNNSIDNIGRANKYDAQYAADGITGYHNGNISPDMNLYYSVTGNEITNWYNHGIHLSGRWLEINNNSVYAPGLKESTGHAVYVGDYVDRMRCSSIIWIQNNYLERSTLNPADAADSIRVHHYKWESYWPYGNSGDVEDGIDITDHLHNNLGNQLTCPVGYADQYYNLN